MEFLDYLPILIVFASAFVGIAGKTWDPEKQGFARLTLKGRVVISIACFSLAYGLFTVHNNHKRLDQKTRLSQIAHRQILIGIAEILTPLCQSKAGTLDNSIEKIFEHIRNSDNLEKAGREPLVSNLGGTIVANTAQGYIEVEQKWQLFDLHIDDGSRLINDALVKFSSVISTQDIINVELVLQDEFFTHNYRLASKKSYFDLGLLDEKNGNVEGRSPWLTAGLHWFDAVYLKGRERAPNYQPLFTFLDKAQTAVTSISRDVSDQRFNPCGN